MDLETAVECGQAVGQAAQTGSGGRIGAADTIIADLHDGIAVLAPDAHRRVLRGARCRARERDGDAAAAAPDQGLAAGSANNRCA